MKTPGSIVNNNAETSVIFDIIDSSITAIKHWNNIAADIN
jgi:hypothetical protein